MDYPQTLYDFLVYLRRMNRRERGLNIPAIGQLLPINQADRHAKKTIPVGHQRY